MKIEIKIEFKIKIKIKIKMNNKKIKKISRKKNQMQKKILIKQKYPEINKCEEYRRIRNNEKQKNQTDGQPDKSTYYNKNLLKLF